MRIHAFRLTKDDDLKSKIENYVLENNFKAGVILSCVGCLYECVLRDASGVNCVKLTENLEIVSITGTLSINGCHIHMSVSDENLKTYGGHLKDGCLINTTAEIVLLELDDFTFTREMDAKTGYKELVVN